MHCKDLNGFCDELIWGVYGLELMWKNAVMIYLKWYVDWNECDRNISRPIWCTMWIRTDDRWWCHDLILRALLIETYGN
jgi:hypothetical protein